MAHHRRISLLLFALLFFISLASAATPTEFCKCTCFNTNSTIIPLDEVPAPEPITDTPDEEESASSKRRRHQNTLRALIGLKPRVPLEGGSATCNDCSKLFCLSLNLPICKDAEEEDVFTTCFQRDSAKDEAVVFIFIFATVGLLIYAFIRPWVDGWIANIKDRQTYIPLADGGR